MKLQKLAFYSQAQHLAQYGASLFPDDFEAWRAGPVAPELYALHRSMFLIRPGELVSGDSSALTDAERALIDSVCSALGSLTGAELSERTHLECARRTGSVRSLECSYHAGSNAQVLPGTSRFRLIA